MLVIDLVMNLKCSSAILSALVGEVERKGDLTPPRSADSDLGFCIQSLPHPAPSSETCSSVCTVSVVMQVIAMLTEQSNYKLIVRKITATP